MNAFYWIIHSHMTLEKNMKGLIFIDVFSDNLKIAPELVDNTTI